MTERGIGEQMAPTFANEVEVKAPKNLARYLTWEEQQKKVDFYKERERLLNDRIAQAQEEARISIAMGIPVHQVRLQWEWHERAKREVEKEKSK